MKPTILYFVDEREEARWAIAPALERFLASPEIKVVPLAPFAELSQFDVLLKEPNLGGFFIDQKMRGGAVTYNGIELAGHLRGLHSKLPIYILTGYPPDDELNSGAYRVEDIVDKEDIEDRTTDKAQILKARILRRLAVFGDVLDAREQRFHDLLVKSMKEPLTADEEKELGILESERLVPAQPEELRNAKALEKAIGELRAKLNPDTLL
ncbi:MAG: hypothetical protein ABMA01_08175 [Chthoniobacteraceae bacterium]